MPLGKAKKYRLKPLSAEQVFYQRMLDLRRRFVEELDLLIREYESTLPEPASRPVDTSPLLDPETGEPFRKRAGGKSC